MARGSDRRAVTAVITAGTVAAWMLLIAAAGGLVVPALCSMTVPSLGIDRVAWSAFFFFNPPGAIAGGWLAMIAAMMLPLLYMPIVQVRARVLRRQRHGAMAAFAVGYFAIWLAAGIVLVPVSIALQLAMPGGWAFAVAAAVACVWHVSPAKQICLNRCHALAPLSPFAGKAQADAARHGVLRGFWCVGNCGPMMLAAQTSGAAHLVAMGLIAVWVFGEQLERPCAPRWRWRAPATLARMVRYRLALAR